jgi:hypothetical protein
VLSQVKVENDVLFYQHLVVFILFSRVDTDFCARFKSINLSFTNILLLIGCAKLSSVISIPRFQGFRKQHLFFLMDSIFSWSDAKASTLNGVCSFEG